MPAVAEWAVHHFKASSPSPGAVGVLQLVSAAWPEPVPVALVEAWLTNEGVEETITTLLARGLVRRVMWVESCVNDPEHAVRAKSQPGSRPTTTPSLVCTQAVKNAVLGAMAS